MSTASDDQFTPTPTQFLPGQRAEQGGGDDDLQAQIKKTHERGDALAEQFTKQLNDENAREEKYQKESEQYLARIRDTSMALAAQNQQQRGGDTTDPLIEKQIQQYMTEQPRGIPVTFGAIMTGVALLFSAFGRHRGWGAQAGIMQGFGNAMTAYMQGNKALSEQSRADALKLMELARLKNQERHQSQMEIMTNQRLTLSEQTEAIRALHEQWGIERGRFKDTSTNYNDQMRALHNQEASLMGQARLKLFIGQKTGELFKSKTAQDWRDYVMNRTSVNSPIGRVIDPAASDYDRGLAEQLYPFEEWIRYEASKPDVITGQKPAPPEPHSLEQPSAKPEDVDATVRKWMKERSDLFGGQ